MAKNNKTRFFYVLYSDKTRAFDQSKRAYYPIYVIISFIAVEFLTLGNKPHTTAHLASIYYFRLVNMKRAALLTATAAQRWKENYCASHVLEEHLRSSRQTFHTVFAIPNVRDYLIHTHFREHLI